MKAQGKSHILITGGAGFIGSHVVRRFVNKYKDYIIVNLDKLTYAGNLANLHDVEHESNYAFVKGDICDATLLAGLFEKYSFDGIIHLAAESHVDRSISNPMDFITTNIVGTVTLLNAARNAWSDFSGKRFYHISTDEVYGSLGKTGYFTETTNYDPRSPYSASKASSDHLVRAYHHTYGLPIARRKIRRHFWLLDVASRQHATRLARTASGSEEGRLVRFFRAQHVESPNRPAKECSRDQEARR